MQQPNPQFSSDYLDQIAARPPVKKASPLMLWGMIGGVLAIAAIGAIVISSNSGGTSSSSLSAVGAKITSLKEVAEKSQKNVQSSELRTINSSLMLVLTNATRDIQGPLTDKDIKIKELKKNKAAATVVADMTAMQTRLEDARLNAVYDRTYSREMIYAIRTLRSDMAVLYKSSGKKLKGVLETTDANLKPLLDSLQAFNA